MHEESFWGNPRTWVGLAFIMFVVIFGKKIWAALSQILDGHSERIRLELAEASRLRNEAEEMLRDAQKRRNAAIEEARRLIEGANAEAARVGAAAAEEAEAAARRREKMALDRIAAAEKAAVDEVRITAAEVATVAAQSVLSRLYPQIRMPGSSTMRSASSPRRCRTGEPRDRPARLATADLSRTDRAGRAPAVIVRKRGLFAACMVAASLCASGADAATFKWANDGDANSMDPYTRSETFLLTFTQNMYDPLVRRGRNLKVEPALAQSWENPSPTIWRFHLRPGVKFQEGQPFTAEDVLFSYRRATAPGSQINAYFATVKEVRKVDDLTVDFETRVPNPIFLEEIAYWGIMSHTWCEEHGATQAADLTKTEENFATRHANGTGPFILKIREPDRRTTLVNNPDWWDKPEHNLTDVQFNVIANAATRVAALLSGDVSMIYTVPPQDIERIGRTEGLRLIQGPELRTVFLGFDQSRDELLKSDVKGKNPFKDQRVREAFNEAVDINAIHQRIMRGQSHPTGLLYGPGVNGYTPESDVRWPYDPAHAKKLLAEAGYPEGFA